MFLFCLSCFCINNFPFFQGPTFFYCKILFSFFFRFFSVVVVQYFSCRFTCHPLHFLLINFIFVFLSCCLLSLSSSFSVVSPEVNNLLLSCYAKVFSFASLLVLVPSFQIHICLFFLYSFVLVVLSFLSLSLYIFNLRLSRFVPVTLYFWPKDFLSIFLCCCLFSIFFCISFSLLCIFSCFCFFCLSLKTIDFVLFFFTVFLESLPFYHLFSVLRTLKFSSYLSNFLSNLFVV